MDKKDIDSTALTGKELEAYRNKLASFIVNTDEATLGRIALEYHKQLADIYKQYQG